MNAVAKPTAQRNAHIRLRVNGEEVEVSFAPYKTLLEVLREDLDLTGTKHGCELGECGACAVLVDGEPLLSCLKLAIECDGSAIETIEGLAAGAELHPLQAAFSDHGGSQCGYCTPGVLMTAKALLDAEPNPSRERIKEALSGNLCRCTGYQQIVDSVEDAARIINETTINETTANQKRAGA
ncbi:MAG: (2Fe-2S)-binding protein [Burkholderiales bacterium]|nr:(2Fe-2S)-binding protein [Burkholderiales bacterium]